MYDKGKIVAGLLIFVVILFSPFLLNTGEVKANPEERISEVLKQSGPGQCIEPAEYMRTNHMQLLNQWRDEGIRNGQTDYVSSSGQKFPVGLETCLKCHTGQPQEQSPMGLNLQRTVELNSLQNTQEQFCNQCHVYADVQPYCWTCHLGQKGAEQ